MIRLEHVKKRFGSNVVLADVCLVTEQGRTYALQGRNGAGKTTLINIALGLMLPDSGDVRVFGENPYSNWAIRKEIGMVGDGDVYFPELTVSEYLWWIGKLRLGDSEAGKKQIDTHMNMFCMDTKGDQLLGTLSHGMRRKVQIASAFIGMPKLIVMDEPTNGLDDESLYALSGLLIDHAKMGHISIIACHDSVFVNKTCTDLIRLDEGKLMLTGNGLLGQG